MFSAPEMIEGFAFDSTAGLLYATVSPFSPHQTSGSLVSLTDSFAGSYVNTTLLPTGVCIP
jgi:hypothetical protein